MTKIQWIKFWHHPLNPKKGRKVKSVNPKDVIYVGKIYVWPLLKRGKVKKAFLAYWLANGSITRVLRYYLREMGYKKKEILKEKKGMNSIYLNKRKKGGDDED